jgi:hypothetical protein
MLHVIESRKAIDGVAKDLEAAATRHKFGVLGTHDLKETMAKKGHAKRYASPELRGVAEEVERTLVAIMEEAAR